MKMPKVGEYITLDCGYRAHTRDERCLILEVRDGKDVWGDPRVDIRVRGDGEEFWTDIPSRFIE